MWLLEGVSHVLKNFKITCSTYLHGPLKRISKAKNQFYLLFKAGKSFWSDKEDIFRVRRVYDYKRKRKISWWAWQRQRYEKAQGRDCKHRTRLSMKKIIAELAGTNRGMILALKALGYWTNQGLNHFIYMTRQGGLEFTIYLSSRLESGVNDISSHWCWDYED